MAEYKAKTTKFARIFPKYKVTLDQKADTECAYQQQGPRARDEFWEESYSKSMILEAVSSRVLG